MSEMQCSACQSKTVEDPTGICYRCREVAGVKVLGPELRPRVPCTRCHGLQIVRVVPRTGGDRQYSASSVTNPVRPLAATFEFQVSNHGIFGTTQMMVDALHGVGELELYICRGCGFSEWFCANAAEIPIGPGYMTQLIDMSSDTPYRG